MVPLPCNFYTLCPSGFLLHCGKHPCGNPVNDRNHHGSQLALSLPTAAERAPVVLEVYDTQKVQYDEYDSDYDQCMNPIPGAREAWTDVPAEKAEQPQNYEYYDDSPQHEISPFDLANDLFEATRPG
jgi:hypothetical protein